MAAPVDDPGGRLDATGRRLEYVPAAVIGNGSLLVTLSARGEVERLLWPHVDGPNAIVELRLGLRVGEADAWLDENGGAWSQEWVGESSVLRTTVARDAGRVVVEDAVDPDEPVLVRRVDAAPGALVVSCTPRLGGDTAFTGAFVDPASRAVVFHRRDVALAIALDQVVAEAGVEPADGGPDDVAHVGPVRGRLEVEHAGEAHVVVAFGSSPFEALSRARAAAREPDSIRGRRLVADGGTLAGVRARTVSSDPRLELLLHRSVLVLDQLTDRATGGIVAAPEMDERFAESGGYGFVWPRDHSYVVLALLAAGRAEQAAAALRWLARVQTPEGLWLHRHWTTGELAPSWGLHQLDETGVALFAMEAAWEELGDEALDAELREHVVRGAEFLVSTIDPASGLPSASVDLWEQQDGQHTYTAAAIVGGLRAAARAAGRHGETARAEEYARAADGVARAIDELLWDAAQGRYRRAVNVARSGGGPPGAAFDRALPYPNRRVAGVAPVDDTLDCSLLGLVWPFRALDPASERVRATVEAVGEGLAGPGGGHRRQEGDTYAGGHEWPLATLWLGLALRVLGDEAALERAVAHVVDRRTGLDLLAEQVDADGRPAWVLPLGWSHAMLLLASLPELRLVDALGADEGAGDGRGG